MVQQKIFSQSQLPVQTLLMLWCPYSLCVQLHASTSVCTLKTQTLAATPLYGHMKILYTLIEMDSAALVAALPY